MSEQERFRTMWRLMDRRQRGEVLRIAYRGKEAGDSSTAWFVVQFTRQILSARRMAALLAVLVAWGIGIGWIWVAYDAIFWGPLVGLGVGVAIVLVLGLRYRRALQLNIPLAEPPAARRGDSEVA